MKLTIYRTFGQVLVVTAFLINISSFIIYLNVDALYTVPKCFKSSSRIEVVSESDVKVYSVEEFVDNQEGSSRLVVSNHAVPSHANDYTSYFRINDKATESIKDHLLTFSHKDQLCQVVMMENWKLSKLTDYMSMLYQSFKFVTPAPEIQSTSIGPTALLQFIQINAALFILKGEVFVEDFLKDMYLFEARDFSAEGSTEMIVICMIPKSLADDTTKLKMYSTSLADLNSEAFPRSVMITELSTTDNYNHLSPLQLYRFNNLKLDRLKVEFDIVQERMVDFSESLDFGAIDFRNPFKIPAGSGCSPITNENSLKIRAKQFSGAYQAQDIPNERHMAFDGQTNMLRLDSFDDYKLVYNLRTKRAIYTSMAGSSCISMSLQGKESDKSLSKVRSIKDVLGFDGQTHLNYLGTLQLDDGTHCVVFEREIYQDEIPLLVSMNLRLRVYSNSRLFLTYYFTSETHISSYQDDYAYRGLWLKRVELLMRVAVSKYNVLCSQITFSQFSWDLESIGTQNAPVLHPARTFDIIECFSRLQQEQIHLQLDLAQDEISEWVDSCDKLSELDETIEEEAIQVLANQLGVSRAQINELEVAVYSGADGKCVFRLDTLLVNHLNYVYESSAIGWLDNMNSPLFEMHVKILAHQEGITMSECMGKLASEFPVGGSVGSTVAMVHCAGAGFCGHLKTEELTLLDYKSRNESGEEYKNSIHVCEIHKLVKSLESDQIIEDKLARNNMERSLRQAYFPIQLETHDPIAKEIKALTLRLKTTSVTISKGGGPEALGTLVADKVCYSPETYLINGRSMGNMNLTVKELTFDKHHSIAYCHRACQLSINCITYSYSSSDRICSLSNIPLELMTQLQDLGNMRTEKSCQIYLMNSMYLFENVHVISYSLLSRLATSTLVSYYLTLADREKCANLCHWNTFYCSEFYHSVADRVCAFEDQNQSLYKMLQLNRDTNEKYDAVKRQKFFLEQIGDNLWNKTMPLYNYRTDYSHFYTKKHSSRVSYAVVQPIGGSLSELYSIHDLTYSACLKECTIKHPDCVIVDFCKTNLDSNCKLFKAKDDYLFKLEQITLDDLGAIDKNLTTDSSICTHHHLKPDSLALKRLLSLRLSPVEIEVKDSIRRGEDDNEMKNESQSNEADSSNQQGINFETVMRVVSILLGILLGFLLINKSGRSTIEQSSSFGRFTQLFITVGDSIRKQNWFKTFEGGRKSRSESTAHLELEVVREE